MIKDKVFWNEKKSEERSALNADETADIVIVRAGMSGLMCAHALALEGKSVIAVEKDFCGGGASGKSLGFICPDSELELSDLISSYGKENAQKLWDFVTGDVQY